MSWPGEYGLERAGCREVGNEWLCGEDRPDRSVTYGMRASGVHKGNVRATLRDCFAIIPWAGCDYGLNGVNKIGSEAEARRSRVHLNAMHGHNLWQES